MNIEPQNPMLSPSLGWLFVGLSSLYLLGLLPQIARIFYPIEQGVAPRAAAPVLFALLAAAFFRGWGLEGLGLIAIVGIVQILAVRSKRRRGKRLEKCRV